MRKIICRNIEDVNNSGLFRYRNLLDGNAYKIGEAPVEFFRDLAFADLGLEHPSFSIVRAKKRELIIDEVEQHYKTEEAIMPLDGDAILFAAKASSEKPIEFEAFYVPAFTLVVFERGVWHKAPYALNEVLNSLVVLPPLTYINDCKVIKLDSPIKIEKECL